MEFMKLFVNGLFWVGLVMSSCMAFANDSSTEVSDTSGENSFSLNSLLNLKLTVSSIVPLTQRESPGIVNIITAHDIETSGARDLVDVLSMLPGFQFTVDMEGGVSYGIRGMIGPDGKTLILWDDLEFTDNLYGMQIFGNHFPVDQIERVEVINGPGSALYGGSAEVGVIKITTKSAKKVNGVHFATRQTRMDSGVAQNNISLMAGKDWGDSSVKLSLFSGKGTRTTGTFTAMDGTSYDMTKVNALNPTQFGLQGHYGGLKFAMLYDHYRMRYQDGYGDTILPNPTNMDFNSTLMNVKYEYKVSDQLKVTPYISHNYYQPWNMTSDEAKSNAAVPGFEIFYFDINSTRDRQGVQSQYDISSDSNLIFGLEQYQDKAENKVNPFNINGKNKVEYNNKSVYGQAFVKSDLVNTTLGARYEKHSQYGESFVPRLALTRVFDRYHMKAMATSAFRAPVVMAIDSNPSLKPEKGVVYEFESGYQFGDEHFLNVNLYTGRITKAIAYTGGGGIDLYENKSFTGTSGYEIQYRLVQEKLTANVAYSYYKANNDIANYRVSDTEKDSLLGFANHKVTAKIDYKISSSMILDATVAYLGSLYGYDVSSPPDNVNYTGTLVKLKPSTLTNLHLQYKNIFTKNLNFGLGIYNAFNVNYRYAQGYDGGYPLLKAHPKQVGVDLAYSAAF